MPLQAWMPWLITAVHLYAQMGLGNKSRNAWLLTIMLSFVSIYYNIATKQPGFLPANLIGIVIAVRNYRKWSTTERKGESCARCEGGNVAGREF